MNFELIVLLIWLACGFLAYLIMMFKLKESPLTKTNLIFLLIALLSGPICLNHLLEKYQKEKGIDL